MRKLLIKKSMVLTFSPVCRIIVDILERNNKKLYHVDVTSLLQSKIYETDFNLAKEDVIPFIKSPDSIALWSLDFLLQLVGKLKTVN
jgi:hypothetical protein